MEAVILERGALIWYVLDYQSRTQRHAMGIPAAR